ncbi:lipase maturation factor family protein [Rhodococcus oryzae]|uniref:Lipase maturation factor family protein n=1 Tax=Rhodococcus oryzae TaxID=2571143 RepID=A0ABY2RLL2_9NOCA|nr:lipase maturation factor family protein [Rhodococcus oryzae]TJZ78479.1 lipase maturation factor family protein [Rhodococcus oryzae]
MDWFVAEGYSLGRLLFKEGLAAIYLVAFLSAVNQFRPLLGSDGLLPISLFLRNASFRRHPSLFHLHYSDRYFAALAWTGVALSAVTLVGLTDRLPLPACMLVWLTLWVLYLSIVNVGQTWYAFGWESLLLETGFLAVFAGNADTASPWAILLLLRWLLFRLEFGAGLIKMRGDSCWRDLTCLYYHHETQPMPGPLSWHFHRLPRVLHRVEVAGNHITQLIVPFGLFAPQPIAGIAAGIMIVTQLWLVASGNFSWLNWMAIVLAVSVLPDRFFAGVLAIPAESGSTPPAYVGTVFAVTALVLVLSYWPVRNLISHRQLMNASFNPWHLVNTYGAFGHVTRLRHEVIVEGTVDEHLTPDTIWEEYEFKGKPGDVRRRPGQFAPYHLRLDWLMWFAAISPSYARAWFAAFIAKLLENDPATLKLLRRNPFPAAPPVFIRATLYRYRFTTRAERRATGAWWERAEVGEFLPPVRLAWLSRR